jgi:hypothetical protein
MIVFLFFVCFCSDDVMLLVGAMLHGVNNWAAMAQNSGLSMLIVYWKDCDCLNVV